MIRINLLRPAQAGGVPASHPLVRRQEAIMGAVLLLLGCGVLFYLASRPASTEAPEPREIVVPPSPPPPVSAPPAAPESTEKTAGAEPAQPAPQEQPAQGKTDQHKPVESTAPQPSPAESVPAKAKAPPLLVRCTVTAVTVQTQAESLTVALRTGAAPKYQSFVLQDPDRLVIDLSNCGLTVPLEQQSQRVGLLQVERIRLSLYQTDPEVVRLVLDVDGVPRYQIRPLPQGLEVRVLGTRP